MECSTYVQMRLTSPGSRHTLLEAQEKLLYAAVQSAAQLQAQYSVIQGYMANRSLRRRRDLTAIVILSPNFPWRLPGRRQIDCQ